MIRLFGAAFVVGVLLGIATSLVFLLIFLVPLLGIFIGYEGLRGGTPDPSYTAASAGLLVGNGSLYLLGAIDTLVSCGDSSVCGGVSALPFLAWAMTLVLIGVVLAGITFNYARHA